MKNFEEVLNQMFNEIDKALEEAVKEQKEKEEEKKKVELQNQKERQQAEKLLRAIFGCDNDEDDDEYDEEDEDFFDEDDDYDEYEDDEFDIDSEQCQDCPNRFFCDLGIKDVTINKQKKTIIVTFEDGAVHIAQFEDDYTEAFIKICKEYEKKLIKEKIDNFAIFIENKQVPKEEKQTIQKKTVQKKTNTANRPKATTSKKNQN